MIYELSVRTNDGKVLEVECSCLDELLLRIQQNKYKMLEWEGEEQ